METVDVKEFGELKGQVNLNTSILGRVEQSLSEVTKVANRIDRTVHNGMRDTLSRLSGCIDEFVTSGEVELIVEKKISEYDSKLIREKQVEETGAKQWLKTHRIEILAAFIAVVVALREFGVV